MLSYEATKENPKRFLALTGLTREEFAQLLEAFRAAWEEYIQREFIEGKERQRKYGGGRKPRLAKLEDKLFFILYYFKTYPIQEALGAQFGMSQSQVNEWLHRLTPVFRAALQREQVLPERVPEYLREALDAAEVPEVALDGAERRRQRPQDTEAQKQYYSGKKKTHTVKNIVIAGPEDREVKYLGVTHAGKKHDKKAVDEEQPTFPAGTVVYQDTGFQGYAPEGMEVRQPKKKPRGKELTEEEKEQNRVISSVRIVVEHVISGIKRCRIVKDVFRNWKEKFEDLVMEIACGLHTFRTRCRTQRTAPLTANA